MQFRPKRGLCIEQHSVVDGFHLFTMTRGDVRASLAPGYQYFAHTGLNPWSSSAFPFPSKLFIGCFSYADGLPMNYLEADLSRYQN
jgi:hypothetical protein